jgi:hypothetical protein
VISDEIVLANMFIGYFVPDDPWPCPFRQYGLELRAIQRPFTVHYAGQLRHVKPEVVLASEAMDYSVALEVKSQTVDDDQLGRYSILDGHVVRRDLALTALSNPRHDVIFFTETANTAALVQNICDACNRLQVQINGNATFPIIERNGNNVALLVGAISDAMIHATFAAGIRADPATSAPSHFIRFTSDSPINLLLPDVVNVVHQNIVRRTDFTTRDVCTQIVGYWNERGTEEKSAFINKVHAIMSKAVQEDYGPFVSVGNMVTGDAGATTWRPANKQLNGQRMQALTAARNNFLTKYRNATNQTMRSGQMPLI